MAISLFEALDRARLRGAHWRVFAIIASNYFLDGVMFSIAPLLAYIVFPNNADFAVLVFAANLLAETIGAILLGILADRLGRRKMFMVSLSIESASLIALFFTYRNPVAFLLLTSLMTFGIGGEFGASYAAIAELFPAKHRGKILMLATNFWNIGSAVIAGLMLVYIALSSNPETQVTYLLASALGTAVVVGLARLGFPESPRWLLEQGRASEAVELARLLSGYQGRLEARVPRVEEIGLGEVLGKYWFRFLVLAVVTIAQYVTYDVTAYYLPYAQGFVFGADIAPMVVFVANSGASIGAFMLLPLIDRARKWSILSAFAGGFATGLLIYYAHMLSDVNLFYAAVFVNLVFSEWAWASLSILQSELFPTPVRASVVGLLTGLQGISGAAIVYTAGFMNAQDYLVLVLLLWLSGLLAASAWYARGIETAGKPLEDVSRA